jgi:hypothetical protein
MLTTIIAGVSLWLSGAWWESERKAASYAMIFAAIMLAIGGLS